MINTSVSRAYLEPSTAVAIHHQLGLPSSCLNFDVANACLGFLNAIQLAATDRCRSDRVRPAGRRRGLPYTQEATLRGRRPRPGHRRRVRSQFATLTLGSGAAAMVLGRADRHPEGHRVVGGVSRAATEHHDLCVGDLDRMRTDTKRLFTAGLELAVATWTDAAVRVRLEGRRLVRRPPDLGRPHQRDGPSARRRQLTFPLTLPRSATWDRRPCRSHWPNTPSRSSRRRVVMLGIGSGLNTSYAELLW